MSYRILTTDELDELADALYPILSEWACMRLRKLFVSHVLLAERVTELETMVSEGIGPEDLRQEIVRD